VDSVDLGGEWVWALFTALDDRTGICDGVQARVNSGSQCSSVTGRNGGWEIGSERASVSYCVDMS
jgi:hypothetical protein